ncbi:protein kinase UbiB [Peptococcaceae bacterium CEB3]|nr:protein kinase UbiB [Peptococcaceae bacterium CEB3]
METLDPELSIMDIAQPFGRRLLMERFRPSNIAEQAWQNLNEYGDMVLELPKQLKELLRNAQRGRLSLQIRLPETNDFLRKLDRMTNQLSFSIVLLSFSIVMAGLIIASAQSTRPILLFHIPAIELGFVFATLMFVWMIFAIFRSGRF